MSKDVKKETTTTYKTSLRSKGRKFNTLSIGGTYKQREKTKRYQKAQKAFTRTLKKANGEESIVKRKVNVAESFNYVANLDKTNLYLYDYTDDVMKVYVKHSDKIEKFFLTAIKKLKTENAIESTIKDYKKEEQKILKQYRQIYNLNGLNDEQVLQVISDTGKVTKHLLINETLSIKKLFNDEFGKLLWKEEQIEQMWKEGTDEEKANLLQIWNSFWNLVEEINNQMKKTQEGISVSETLISLGTNNKGYNGAYTNAFAEMHKLIEEICGIKLKGEETTIVPDPEQLPKIINKLRAKWGNGGYGLSTHLGTYGEAVIAAGLIEGLTENLPKSKNRKMKTTKANIKTGEITSDKISDIVEEKIEPFIADNIFSKKRTYTSSWRPEMNTIDGVIEIEYFDSIVAFNFDIKTYDDHYSIKPSNKEITMKDILDSTKDVSGDDAGGRLLFANIVASQLVSSLISPESNLHRLLYYWTLLKDDGFGSLFGKTGNAAHFIIFANKLKPLSFLLETVFNDTTKIDVKTSVNYNSFNNQTDGTLEAKKKAIQTYKGKWRKHSEESFDELYKNSGFASANQSSVNMLNQVIFTQKRASYKQLDI